MIKKINIAKLDTGMFVHQLDRSWWDTPFFSSKNTIKNRATIDKLKNLGIKYVFIDTAKGKDCSDAISKKEHDQKISRQLQSQIHHSGKGDGMIKVL